MLETADAGIEHTRTRCTTARCPQTAAGRKARLLRIEEVAIAPRPLLRLEGPRIPRRQCLQALELLGSLRRIGAIRRWHFVVEQAGQGRGRPVVYRPFPEGKLGNGRPHETTEA